MDLWILESVRGPSHTAHRERVEQIMKQITDQPGEMTASLISEGTHNPGDVPCKTRGVLQIEMTRGARGWGVYEGQRN